MKSEVFLEETFHVKYQSWIGWSSQVLACALSNGALMYSNTIEAGRCRDRWFMFWSNLRQNRRRCCYTYIVHGRQVWVCFLGCIGGGGTSGRGYSNYHGKKDLEQNMNEDPGRVLKKQFLQGECWTTWAGVRPAWWHTCSRDKTKLGANICCFRSDR